MASHSVICYPQPGKLKSRVVLDAFAHGCKGGVRITPASVLEPGAAAFYGVVGIEHLLRMACAEEREWYYGDNAFFDTCRQKYYRFARNQLQANLFTHQDPARWNALRIPIVPWQSGGAHIVIVEQSEHFLSLSGYKPGEWLGSVLSLLKKHTDRSLRIRTWQRDKAKAARTLHSDLKGAWALVTHASAAANEALLAGVPVYTSSKCAAFPLSSGQLSNIESPIRPDGREGWAACLAAQQWTLEELRAGAAWKLFEEQRNSARIPS